VGEAGAVAPPSPRPSPIKGEEEQAPTPALPRLAGLDREADQRANGAGRAVAHPPPSRSPGSILGSRPRNCGGRAGLGGSLRPRRFKILIAMGATKRTCGARLCDSQALLGRWRKTPGVRRAFPPYMPPCRAGPDAKSGV